MRNLAFVIGGLLVVLGLATFLSQAPGHRSPTALIPALFGGVFVVCGAVATTPARNKHAMHVGAVVGLLGTGVLGMALPKWLKSLGGEALARPTATYAQLATGLLCLVFLVAAIRSFVQARVLKKDG